MLELVEVQGPRYAQGEQFNRLQTSDIISPVISGQIEVDGDKGIVRREQRYGAALQTVLRVLSFFPPFSEEPSCFVGDWFHAA